MNRIFSAIAAIALSAFMLANPVLARSTTDPQIAQWSQRVGRDLDDHLEQQASGVRDATGVATIKFNCTEEGRAANAVILTSSGNRRIDAAALRAVNAVRTYHPLPAGLGHGQPIVARLSYDTDQFVHQRRLADNRAFVERSNAWYHAPLRGTATIGDDEH